jgi:hypothetical protein
MMVSKGVDHMNRSLIFILFAIFLILATAATLAAQGHGHFGGGRGFSGAPAVRSGPPVASLPPVVAPFTRPPAAAPFAHGPVVAPFTRPPVVAPFTRSPVVAPFAHGPVAGPFHGPGNGFRQSRSVRPVVGAPVFGYYSPYIYGYGGPEYYPYPAPAYSEPAYAYPGTQPPAVSQNEIDLAYQVGQLSAQVQQLEQQQSATSYTQPSSSPQRAVQQESTPTVLVFQDGRRMEIQNYAVIGETLWVLDPRVATKIPLSDLDLDATRKENRSRGVRFTIPQK